MPVHARRADIQEGMTEARWSYTTHITFACHLSVVVDRVGVALLTVIRLCRLPLPHKQNKNPQAHHGDEPDDECVFNRESQFLDRCMASRAMCFAGVNCGSAEKTMNHARIVPDRAPLLAHFCRLASLIGYDGGMRIRPRFRLRTLFALIAIVSIPMDWVAYQLN